MASNKPAPASKPVASSKPALGGAASGYKPSLNAQKNKPEPAHAKAAPVGLMKDGDDDEDNYDEDEYDGDDFDEDEEENFKKTAADFQKKLTELKNQNN
jgi:hypothetical protein